MMQLYNKLPAFPKFSFFIWNWNPKDFIVKFIKQLNKHNFFLAKAYNMDIIKENLQIL